MRTQSITAIIAPPGVINAYGQTPLAPSIPGARIWGQGYGSVLTGTAGVQTGLIVGVPMTPGVVRFTQRAFEEAYTKAQVPDPIGQPTFTDPPVEPFPKPRIEKLQTIRVFLADVRKALVQGDTYLTFQYIPTEVEIGPSSYLRSLNVVGRDSPIYHYGGGEQIIKFIIHWIGYKVKEDTVIGLCKKWEDLTLASKWGNEIPEIVIGWGDGETFKDQYFLVEKAKYVIKNFSHNKIEGASIIPFGLKPTYAEQTITLRRVTK